MSRALIALLAVFALLAGALWLVTSTDRRPVTGDGADLVAAATPPDAGRERDALEGASPEAPRPTEERAAERASLREVAPTAREEELSRAQWVEGRVVFPPGTPPDEEAFVAAEGRPFSSGGEHRAKVGADGSFRVAFSEITKAGALRLDARYLFLRGRATWRRGDVEPLVLEPELGGRITVRVVAPDDVDAPPRGEVQLDLKTTRGADQRVARRVPGPEGEIAFDALLPERRYGIAFDGDAVGAAEDTVRAGETHAIVLELARGVRLAGRVVDERGEPLEGAWIQAHTQRVGQAFSPGAARGVRVEADGRFALEPLFAGALVVQASLAGRVTGVLELGTLDDGAERSDVEVVLARGGTIAGVVTWPDGTPAQASLELEPLSVPGDVWVHGQTVRDKSAADGRFRIGGLVAEEHLVRARASTKERVTFVDVGGRESERWEETRWTAEIERVATGSEHVVLVLSAGHALAGRVVDDRGVPLDDFRVSASRARGTRATVSSNRADLSNAFRDAGGTFALEGFTPGDWLVEAGAKGHARSEPQRVTMPDARLIELVAPREARVSGVVLDVDGDPCADAELELAREDRRGPGDRGASGVGGRDGTFTLDGLAPGRVRLLARSSAGTTSEPLGLELVPGETVADVVLRLRAGATVTGEVHDRDGRPMAGVPVSVHTPGGPYRPPHTTDANGRFEARGLSPGRVQVYVIDAGGLQLSQLVTLTEGGSAHVVLAPPRTAGVRLHGRIAVDGAALARGRIGAHRSGPQPADTGARASSNSATDAEGRYELTLPGPGVYGIWVHGTTSPRFTWSTPVDVPPVAELALDVAIPLGRISGRVTRTTGEPLHGVRVSATSRRDEGPKGHGGGSASGSVETDEGGRYELPLPTGTYTVRAGGDRHGAGTDLEFVAVSVGDLVLDAGAHLRGVDFELASGGVLVGELIAGDGVDPTNAMIISTERWLERCDGSSFRIGAMSTGKHTIRATTQRAASRWTTVAIEVGETTRVTLELEPATTMVARVRTGSGTPVDCPIGASDADGNTVPTMPTGKPGEVHVPTLTRGRYTLRAYCPGKVVERTVEVAGTEPTVEVELVLE